MIRYLSLLLLLLCFSSARADDDGLLLHWKLDEGRGGVARDASGQGIDGKVTAAWVASPSGGAVEMNGTPATLVSVTIPEGKRLGKDSWTFMVWVKPRQFTIESRQNQRRLFAYGNFPKAFIGVDIFGDGRVSLYQTYQADGKSISSGGGATTNLSLDKWAHVAVACDRKTKRVSIYINGRLRGEQDISAEFDGDFDVDGELTIGNGWQNYMGVADEVRLYRRALAKNEVRGIFEQLRTAFNVVPTPQEVEADALEAIQGSFATANQAWAKKDFAGARKALAAVLNSSVAPAHYRSYAHLRVAQSYAAQGNAKATRAEYAKIAAAANYPRVHRTEAAELVRELDRKAAGKPARDPAATRVTAPALKAPVTTVYVAPGGSDSNPGTAAKPLKTLTAARDKARTARGKGGVAVVLAPGEYAVTDTLELTEQDGGTAAAPVVYRAQKPGTAVLYGGVRLTGFAPVTDAGILARLPAEARGKVVQLDLKARGITDYGTLAVRGFAQPLPPPTLELYVDRQPQTLSRWPNTGFVHPTKLIEPGVKKEGKPSVFGYEDERHARWTQAKDAWLFGYFHFLWADATAKIGKIDTAEKTITTAEAYEYGGRGMSEEQGIAYYAFNLLEEIDLPGEWYLDRDSGVLYLYPPTDLSKATVELSMLDKPMITANKLANARFEGLVFDLSRANGIEVTDSTNVLFAGCTIQRMAGNGISIIGGSRNTLLSCDVHTIGRRATEVIGGDRETLTPGGHVVANCRIHNFGRIDRTYTPAIQLEGVGNRVVHNLFYNSPSSVMRIEGNDHLIEYNEVRDAVLESDDQGAMELFRNPTYRGVIFRYNLFNRVGSPPARKIVHGQAGIRFDDAISDMLVYGNIFYRSANGHFGGVQMNSGRDNIMDNNIFAEMPQGISGGYNAGNNVWKQLREGNKPPEFITSELYLQRYPKIATMLETPAVNHVWRNIFYRVGNEISGNKAAIEQLANGVFDKDPGFVDAAKGNLRLKPNAPVFATVGFRPIPVDEIGLYPDPWRPAAGPSAKK